MRDLVLGIDASTTAVKVIAFDRKGKPHAESRATYPHYRPAPGHFEQDADDWWTAFVTAVSKTATAVGGDRIAALAIGQQRETFVLLDKAGKPTHPAILWLDERARVEVAELCDLIGADRIHAITGKPADPTPALYSLAWLKKYRPEALDRADLLLDVHGYLAWRLTGERVTALPAADPLGLVDLATGDFHPDLVAASGLGMNSMPALVPAGARMGTLLPAIAEICGLPADVALFAGAGDGQMTGLGVGAIDDKTAYLSLGSGVVTGYQISAYNTDRAYRTMASSTGSGFMVETVIRSGMQLVDWIVALTGYNKAPDGIMMLETEALKTEPGADNLFCVPYFAGVMNPYWDGAARGILSGLSLSHTPGHFLRAALEGLAFEQAIATAALEDSLGVHATRFIACGGGLKSRLLPDIMAAVLNRSVVASPVQEGVALGAAILAASGAGWYDSVGSAASEMVATAEKTHEPNTELVAIYKPRIALYEEIYLSLKSVQDRVAKL